MIIKLDESQKEEKMNQFSNREEVEQKALTCAWSQFEPQSGGCVYVTPEGNVLFVKYDYQTQKVTSVGNVTINPDWLRKE